MLNRLVSVLVGNITTYTKKTSIRSKRIFRFWYYYCSTAVNGRTKKQQDFWEDTKNTTQAVSVSWKNS